MTYTIKLTPEARIDVQDAKEYYKLKSKKLAKEFLQNVDLAFEPLKTNPFLFQRGYRGIRKSPIAKFKSFIHYFT